MVLLGIPFLLYTRYNYDRTVYFTGTERFVLGYIEHILAF